MNIPDEYLHYVEFPNGRDACLVQLAFTCAVIADLNEYGYGDRWCYKTYQAAKAALDEWTSRGGEGEPNNWHRHPNTGRRRENGDPAKEEVRW